jgi:ectoine hydroxylase-related dioxygenase (phytanoyl-CoA dioxygenase family)
MLPYNRWRIEPMSTASTKLFTADQLAQYQSDGYLLVRNLYTTAEIDHLYEFAQSDSAFQQSLAGRKDAKGTETKIALWNHAGADLYSMFARSRRQVERMEQCLADEVYLYHMKMNVKDPRVGGAWEWHQDYGYWYNNGCLFPNMASCMISVTPSSQENGCLQVIRGSHALGRIDHLKIGDQTGADLERVEVALERLQHVYVESRAGDALFFHSNLLHRSDQNLSAEPRWSLICCYNARSNDPYKESKHPRYTPLEKVDDGAIVNWTEAQA